MGIYLEIKHYNHDWKDGSGPGPGHGHHRQPYKLPPPTPEKRHYCKCWQKHACVSCRIVSMTHNMFRKPEPEKEVGVPLVRVTKTGGREFTKWKEESVITVDFKHPQSSTRGIPGCLRVLRMKEPLCGPYRNAPIKSMLPSKWSLCLFVSLICFRVSLFFSDPFSDFLYLEDQKT